VLADKPKEHCSIEWIDGRDMTAGRGETPKAA